MERLNGLDRLLYLVCTGGAAISLQEKLGLSQAALCVIRTTLPEDQAKEIVLHTLAPPMSSSTSPTAEGEQPELPPPPTIVQKLLNTVLENLDDEAAAGSENRPVFLSGALGALGLFFQDETCREMMLKITGNLLDTILTTLEEQSQ